MVTVNNLSLRIYGSVLDDGMETQPLVAVGSVPNEFRPIPPMIVDEQQVWMITHAQSYTLYAVYSKRCRTAEDLLGQILICIFLPPQQRLADGNSPLGLLDSLMDCFAVQALRGGKLPNTSIDSSPFKMLLGRYRLEERPVLLPIMQGLESSAFCVEGKTQLDAIMRHSRYPVLSGVSRLELGYHCNSTIMLKTQGTPFKKEVPNNVVQSVSVEPEPPKQVNYVSGGLSLDEGPTMTEGTPWYKKLLKVAAIFIGGILCLLVVFVVVGGFMDDDKKLHVAENKSVSVEAQEDKIESNETLVIEEKVKENKNAELPTQEAQQETQERAVQIAAQVSQKEAYAAKKKAEVENARKKAEEARKKNEEAAKNAKWQTGIQQYANSCPIQLRIGVRITSIVCTPNSVTYTVNYEELSKYDMDSNNRNNLAADRSNILKKYGIGIPSNVHTNIIQKDKAGRTL